MVKMIQYFILVIDLALVVLGVALGESLSSLLHSGTDAHPVALRYQSVIEGERPWTPWRPHKILERTPEHEVILPINERVTRAAEIPASNDNQHAKRPPTYSLAITTQIPDVAIVEKPPTSDESIDESAESMDLTTPLLMSTENDPTEDELLITVTVESAINATTVATIEDEYLSDYQPDSTTSNLDFEDSTPELTETSYWAESSENNSLASNNSSNRSIGRALSHEDINWQVKSTKIIGTIIEDIRPYGDNTVVLTLGSIIAISLCIVIVLISLTGITFYLITLSCWFDET